MPTLVDVRGQIEDRRKQLATIFEEAGDSYDMDKVKCIEGDSTAKVDKIKSLNTELGDLQVELDKFLELEAIKKRTDDIDKPPPHPGHRTDADDAKGRGRDGGEQAKSVGLQFAEAMQKQWKQGAKGQVASAEIDALFTGGRKATFTTGGSNLAPLSFEDIPGIQLINQQRLTVADLLASGVTTRESIRYVVEQTYTNAATVVAEGGLKPEASWDINIVTDPVTKIAVLSRVTDELFADFPMLRDYIDNRMRFMLGQNEEVELLRGDGTGVHLKGLLARTGLQTQAKGGDPTPDAIYKAMVKIQTGPFVDPDGVVMHPLDWQDVALLRTADGIYIWGQPNDPSAQPRIWGLPVVVTTAETQNTALVGAFKIGAQVWRRQGIQVDATNSNEDDFKHNLIMLRAEERLGLSVYLPSAFCTVTGV